VPIVATAVKDAVIDGMVRKVVGFLDGQSVHIRPQPDRPIALTSPKDTNHARPAYSSAHLQPEFLEESRDFVSRPYLSKAQLRMFMDIVPPSDHFAVQLAGRNAGSRHIGFLGAGALVSGRVFDPTSQHRKQQCKAIDRSDPG